MVEILGEPYKLSLVSAGTALSLGDAFGTIEGYKITSDLLTPVSGAIIEINDFLLAQSNDFGKISQINDDPYNTGWMIVVQLSNPNELKSLMTAQSYSNLIASQG
jgi:glycine cleavage system H protein